jgi:hypothetical protein
VIYCNSRIKGKIKIKIENLSFFLKMRFQKYRQLYFQAMPLFAIYPTIIGIDTGLTVNRRVLPEIKPFDQYANVIGYTSLGIVTGLTYPISYPLFGTYILYNINWYN